MATAVHCISSCFSLTSKLGRLSLNSPSTSSLSSSSNNFRSLGFSRNISDNVFSQGYLSISVARAPKRLSIVCEAAPQRKADSAEKRARQNEKRRMRNKSRKSEARTRMKKVLVALEVLRKKKDAQSEEITPIETLIAEAYSAIDKAVKIGAFHRNTGANRKSRLARRKKAIMIHHGWYTPAAPVTEAA